MMKKMYNSPLTESVEINTLGVIMSGSGGGGKNSVASYDQLQGEPEPTF